MFASPASRYALRCALFGVAALVATLKAALPGIGLDEALDALLTGFGGALTYAGIGAILPQVEPHIGNKL